MVHKEILPQAFASTKDLTKHYYLFIYFFIQIKWYCILSLKNSSSSQIVITAHVTAGMVDLTRHEKEKYFLTSTGEKQLFPSLHDSYSRELSVVIPAYNEEDRSEF